MLRVLWGLNVPATAAEIARRTRLTHPAAAQVLRRLSDQGLVGKAPSGRGYTYWLERENAYVEEIIDSAFLAERDIPDMMVAEVESALGPCSFAVYLFGSYARGDQDSESDVDIMAVATDEISKPELQAAVDVLATVFPHRFGANLSPIVYGRQEARGLAQRAPDLYRSVRDEGVCVTGADIDVWGAGDED